VGPLDQDSELDGKALETLVLSHLRAHNEGYDLGYELYFWRTSVGGHEVDFVLYGEKGLLGIEVKKTAHLRSEDFRGLLEFKKDYPVADVYMFYGGSRDFVEHGIRCIPVDWALTHMNEILKG
jgi:predicted AAA+ superfamily ATPase